VASRVRVHVNSNRADGGRQSASFSGLQRGGRRLAHSHPPLDLTVEAVMSSEMCAVAISSSAIVDVHDGIYRTKTRAHETPMTVHPYPSLPPLGGRNDALGR